MTRVALYGRVSTSDGRQEVDNQLSELRQFAERHGWEIIHEYIDHESGSKADRAEFRRMFTDAAQTRFDLVLVWALDRLTREGVAETFEHIKRLSAHGVEFVSFTEEHFRTTGPAGELMIAVAAWIAKQERLRISERVKAALNWVKREGTRSGRPVGRPRVVLDGERIRHLRDVEKLTWPEIARRVHSTNGSVRRAYSHANEQSHSCQNAMARAQ